MTSHEIVAALGITEEREHEIEVRIDEYRLVNADGRPMMSRDLLVALSQVALEGDLEILLGDELNCYQS